MMGIGRHDGSYIDASDRQPHGIALQEIEIQHLIDKFLQDTGTLRDKTDHVSRLFGEFRRMTQDIDWTGYHCNGVAELVRDIGEEVHVHSVDMLLTVLFLCCCISMDTYHAHAYVQAVDNKQNH